MLNGTEPRLDPATLAVHGGRELAPGAPLAPPAVFASVYRAGGETAYARQGNPTWAAFERALAALEGGADAVAFASGMAAASALLATLPRGARVVAGANAHVESRRLLAEREADGALELALADSSDPGRFVAALEGADVAWIDSISNPTLEVAAVDAIAAGARRRGVALVVDATLATPILQRPLAMGAAAVLHSASKYLAGHSDALLGAVATRDRELAERLRRRREALGATPGTMEAWLALRGLRTLDLRLTRGQESAELLAPRVAAHPEVLELRRPGGRDIAPGGPLAGPGSMLSFTVRGGARRADAVCGAVELIVHAGSLGGVETLIERHGRWHDEACVPDALLRLSVGCEHPEDVWRDLDRALRSTARPRPALSRAAPAPAA